MKKVMFVEDDPFILDYVSQKLIADGYAVVVCTDGNTALSMIESEQPDVILLDIGLPNKDGFTILQEMKSIPLIANTPVIIFSNDDSPENQARAVEYGAQDFFMKASTHTDELIKKIESVLPVAS